MTVGEKLPFAGAILLFPGSWALKGPSEARGPLGGKLFIWCWYDRDYEAYRKYWCRGTNWKSCHIVVQTSDSETTVKQGRVSITDIRTNHVFIVTMENLTEGDFETYWCGIEKSGFDLMFSVKVSVLPVVTTLPMPAPKQEPTPAPKQEPTPAPKQEPTPAPKQEPTTVDVASTKSLSTRTALEVTEPNSTIHSSNPPARTTNPALHILLPCLLVVPLLILITAVVLIKTSRRRNKALEGASGQREKNPSRLVSGNAPAFLTEALAASSGGAICMKTEKTTDSAVIEAVYEHIMQDDPGFRMDRRDGSRHSDISSLTSIYVNMKPNTHCRTHPSPGQPKHGTKATG